MRFSGMVLGSINDGDLQTKIEDIEYSTSPRDVVTVEDMEKYRIRIERMEMFKMKVEENFKVGVGR